MNFFDIPLPRRRTVLLIAVLLLLCVLLAYGRSLWQDFAPLDDDLLVVHNLAIRGMTLAHLRTVFTSYDPELYIPLTFVSYQLNYLIAGLHPWIYHLTNIVLHAGNALLVGWLLLLLTKKRVPALIGALLFAVHPINTEAVVWIAGRKDLLSTLFFLLSFIAYLRYRAGTKWNYGWSIAFFLLALLSKVMAVTLPVMLILSDALIERRKWNVKMIMDKLPYLALSGIFYVVATAGKERVLAHHSLLETALMAGKSTVFYLEKILLPMNLGVFYPYSGPIALTLPTFFVPLIVLLTLAGVTLWSLRWNRWIAFGAAFFIVTLAPTFINFHKGGEIYFASDRYPYLPMIGLLFLLTMTIATVWEKTNVTRRASAVIAAIPIVILCALSFLQTTVWDSPETLFAHTLALYPQSVAARVALASMDRQTGKYDDAATLLNDGLQYGDNLELHMALGTLYAKVGQVDQAQAEFEKAQALDPENPEPVEGLGVLDEYRKNIPKAMAEYARAVALDPSFVEARNDLASLLLEQGKIPQAEEQLRAAIRWNPNADGVLFNLSLALDTQGKSDEARADLESAYALNPDSEQITLALAEHLLETDTSRAYGLARQALKTDQANAEAQDILRRTAP